MRAPQTDRPTMQASSRGVLHESEDVSAAPFLAIPGLLREMGLEPGTVLERVGIDERTLGDAANRLPFSQAGRLLEECAAASACPHFGLLLGIREGPAAAGIAGGLIGHADSVRAALRLFIAHLHLNDRGGVAALDERPTGEVTLSYAIHHPDTHGAAQILDLSIAVACTLMRRLSGPWWMPTAVMLSHARPRNLRPYRSFFRAPVTLDAPHSALVFPAHWLDRAVADDDPVAGHRLLSLAAELDAARPATVTELTIRALSRLVIATPPSTDRVAQALGFKPRRLRQRLEAEGSSVKELLEDLRCERARQLLEVSRMPIAEIAATLHYSRPGAFSRAFKGWTGRTPRQWRTAAWRRPPAAMSRLLPAGRA
jgi:AraC-like DNA-binding protein